MIRYSHLLKLMALIALCAALSSSVLAQKEIVVWVVSAVKKDQARATNDPSGKGLLVPVTVKLEIVLPDTAKLKQVELELVTKNTDGSTAQVKKLVPIEDLRGNQIIHEIKLPMAKGVFAKSFNLKATAKILIRGEPSRREITQTATKSGVFAVEQGK